MQILSVYLDKWQEPSRNVQVLKVLVAFARMQKYEGCLRRAKLTDNTIMLWNDGCANLPCHGCTV